MTRKNGAAASGSIDPGGRIEELTAESERLRREQQRVDDEVKRLMAEEDIPAGKTYAREIHDLRQDKMRLEVEILFLQQKMRRLAMGLDENDTGPLDPQKHVM